MKPDYILLFYPEQLQSRDSRAVVRMVDIFVSKVYETFCSILIAAYQHLHIRYANNNVKAFTHAFEIIFSSRKNCLPFPVTQANL